MTTASTVQSGTVAIMGLPVEKHRYSIAEYLELEAKSVGKNEFHNGEILAMAGGTYKQSQIKTHLIVLLGTLLRGHRCGPLDSDMRVRIGNQVDYVYPDALILCGPPQFDPDDRKQTTILNPSVIFEVLSESTEAYDRGDKFSLYREIDSLQEYVLVSQDKPRIELYLRQPDRGWLFTHFDGLEAAAKLRSIEIELQLSEVYEGVSFVTTE